MLQVICSICRRPMPGVQLSVGFHACERCQPFAEEFAVEVTRLTGEAATALERQIERYRAEFVRTKIGKQKPIAAVPA